MSFDITGSRAGDPALKPLRQVDEEVVGRMTSRLEGQTDQVLMRQFGISYNTWRKIRSGKPIRRSVADRLETRVRACCSAR